MDTYLLTFIAVVENKSFTKAAEQLHLTQPAVSQAIRNLEKELGTVLIERQYKTFHLNKAGEIVYTYAKETVSRYETMKTMVSELKNNPAGLLTIGASYTIGEYIIPNIFHPLREKYPLIQPNVIIGNTEHIVDLLQHRQIDIGVVEGDVHHPWIVSQPFMTDEMYIYGNKRITFEERLPKLSDLSNLPWIIRERGSGTRKMTEQFLTKNQIKPTHLFTFGSTQIIKGALETGQGISLLSKWAVQKELALDFIWQLPIDGVPVERQFSIIKIEESYTEKTVQVFEQLIMEHYM